MNDKPDRMPNVPPFVKFVASAVPMVFDNSLSYYEALCALWKYIQGMTDVVNNNATLEEEYIEKFDELKSFVDGYFDDLDVQQEIDNKLDKMAQDGTLSSILQPLIEAVQTNLEEEQATFENNVNTTIQGFRTELDAKTSGSPIPVSSVEGMTDHDRIYVNTSNGYWYYWDGDSWEQGAVYQATELDNFSVSPVKTTFSKRSENLIDVANANVLEAHPASDGMHSTANARSVYISCQPNTTYTISRSVNTGRFGAATFETEPTTSSSDIEVNSISHNTAYSFTITTNADSHYLLVYYWHRSYSQNTATEALADLCVVEGTSDGTVIPSYIISVTHDNLGNAIVEPANTTFAKNSANLFNKDDYSIVNANPSAGSGQMDSSASAKSVYIPCEAGKSYVVNKIQTARFSVATTQLTPAAGVSLIDLVYKNTATQLKITASQNANYLVVYLYNSSSDVVTLQQVIDSLVICEGTKDITSYIPYGKIIEVKTENLNDQCVTSEKLSSDVAQVLTMTGSLASRNGIYGVEYDITNSSSACTRIGNAVGLHNDFIVEDTYQLNGGVNDFDNIFPWSDIKRCNVVVSSDGTRSVTYEGETGFALDGSNGNVMVEIPKFYSMRKRIGNTETLAISGEPKSGFNVEPAFLVNGKEQDFIYVSCYHQSESLNGVYSYTNSIPTTLKTMNQNIAELGQSNLQSYDFTVFLALEKLMIIEFANRSVQQYLGGMTRLPYYTQGTTNVIDGFGTNYITFQENVGQQTMKAFWVGERIVIGNSLDNIRTITEITKSGTQYKVVYDGDDLSSVISIGEGVGCVAQKNGWCDELEYHTGRRNFASDTNISNYVSPMRYRYIENVIGNVWEQISGIRVKDLSVRFSFEPNFNASYSDSSYKSLNYSLPLQADYPSGNTGWIIKDGYDVNNRQVNLPLVCNNTGGVGRYNSGTVYTYGNSGVEYIGVVGGGWDTYYWANINTIRFWNTDSTTSILYGNRPVHRG